MPTRPLLACKVTDIAGLSYPLLATPKIDGIRALRLNQTLLTRSFKELPNDHVRNYLTTHTPDGLDGELVVLETGGDTAGFNSSQSGFMSEAGIPLFKYLCFDYCPHGFEHVSYQERVSLLQYSVRGSSCPEVVVVPTTRIEDGEQLTQYEEECLKGGYEGVCLRLPSSTYKSGRSTLRESFLLKLKRFEDAEAKVVGFQELETNSNVATVSELGLLKRGHSKANKRAANTLGALIVENCKDSVTFNIGTGFTEEQRDEIWANREQWLGEIVTYKHQPFGAKDKPRIPVFKGRRSVLDL